MEPPEVLDLVQLPSLAHPEKDPSWRADARCLGSDTETFYPDRGGNVAKAKLICYGCPVRTPCAQFAIDNKLRDGVFGGLSDKDRRGVINGSKTTDITLADVLKHAFYAVNHKYPSSRDQWFYRYGKDVIKEASRSINLSTDEIYDNIDNSSDYVI